MADETPKECTPQRKSLFGRFGRRIKIVFWFYVASMMLVLFGHIVGKGDAMTFKMIAADIPAPAGFVRANGAELQAIQNCFSSEINKYGSDYVAFIRDDRNLPQRLLRTETVDYLIVFNSTLGAIPEGSSFDRLERLLDHFDEKTIDWENDKRKFQSNTFSLMESHRNLSKGRFFKVSIRGGNSPRILAMCSVWDPEALSNRNSIEAHGDHPPWPTREKQIGVILLQDLSNPIKPNYEQTMESLKSYTLSVWNLWVQKAK